MKNSWKIYLVWKAQKTHLGRVNKLFFCLIEAKYPFSKFSALFIPLYTTIIFYFTLLAFVTPLCLLPWIIVSHGFEVVFCSMLPCYWASAMYAQLLFHLQPNKKQQFKGRKTLSLTLVVNDCISRSIQADMFIDTSVLKIMKNADYNSINKAQKQHLVTIQMLENQNKHCRANRGGDS